MFCNIKVSFSGFGSQAQVNPQARKSHFLVLNVSVT